MPFAFEVGRLLGIRIRIHALFVALILLIWVTQSTGRGAWSGVVLLVYMTLLFAFVLIHELGHSLMAKRFGVQVVDITLWPLGGMARLRQVPETPKIEMAIAVAGPAVNMVLAAVGLAVAHFGQMLPDQALLDPSTWFALGSLSWHSLLAFCIGVNLVMGTFNLIPAFPLDGGRVLRAVLGWRFDFLRSTILAAQIGRLIATVLFLGAVWLKMLGTDLPVLGFLLIAVFVHIAGRQEELAVRIRKQRESEQTELSTPRPAEPPRLSREEYQKALDRLPEDE
ncbi:MAG: site-2 protease family protein [Planctomycetota bacterium]